MHPYFLLHSKIINNENEQIFVIPILLPTLNPPKMNLQLAGISKITLRKLGNTLISRHR